MPKENVNTQNGAWADPKQLGISDRSFFKPEDGKTKRVKMMGDPVRAHVQWVTGLGFVHTHCEYEEVKGNLIMREEGLDMQLLGKEPQLVWMVPVLVYDTDKKGQIGNKKPANLEYEFQLWSFYATDYKTLYGMVTEWGIEEFNKKDLLVSGEKKGKYINAKIDIGAKEAFYLDPALKERVDNEFAAYQYRDAKRWIARHVTAEELTDAIGKLDKPAPKGSAKDAMK